MMRSARPFLVGLKRTLGTARVRVSTAKDGGYMYSTHVGYIPHPTLPRGACRAFIFDDISANLFSYVQLARNGCRITLEKSGVTITDAATDRVLDSAPLREGDKVFMHHWRLDDVTGRQTSANSGVERLDEGEHQANTLIHNLPAVERARLWRDILLGKPTTTILNAIKKGWLSSFPGLTTDLITKHLPYHSEAQALGHLDKTRKNRASTAKKPSSCMYGLAGDDDECEDDVDGDGKDAPTIQVAFVSKEEQLKHAQTLFMDEPATMRDIDKSALSDCLIVMLNGYLKIEHMKNGTGAEMARAYSAALEYFQARSKTVLLNVLDNKCPKVLIDVFRAKNIPHQLVPPYQKRTNRAERGIRTFKNAVISSAAIAGKDFPMAKYAGDTVQHFEVVLNVLRPCGTDKDMSAWEWMHGAKYDFNRHPLLPVGMPVTVYDQPRTHPRGAWGNHGSPGHYVSPALDHYRCWVVAMSQTKKIRVASTLECHPKDVVLPGASRCDRLTAALTDLSSVLRELAGQVIPDASEEQLHQVRQLNAVFTERAAHRERTENDKPQQTVSDVAAAPDKTTTRAAMPPPAREGGAQHADVPPGAATTQQANTQQKTAPMGQAATISPAPPEPPAAAPAAILQRVAGSSSVESAAQRSTLLAPRESISSAATLQRVAGGSSDERAQERSATASLEATSANTSPWTTILETAPNKVARALPAIQPAAKEGETASRSALKGSSAASQRSNKSKVHWKKADAAETKADETQPAATAPLAAVRKSGRHAARKAKERARTATALLAEENAAAAAAADQSVLADAMLRAAAERTDQEAAQMRRDADALPAIVHRALNGFVMREMQAEYALRVCTHPFNHADTRMRQLAMEEREAAISEAAHVAMLLSDVDDQDNDDDEADDHCDGVGRREICPDKEGHSSGGVAYGTVDDETGEAINLRKESKPGHKNAPGWHQARVEEIERLIVTTGCMKPMAADECMRAGATVSYVAWAASYKYDDNKDPLFRMRGAYGGNVLKNHYVGETAAQTASLPAFKILINAVLSTPGAKFMTLDLKDMYLQSDLEQPEYVAIPVAEIPAESMTRHKLHDKVRNGRVYFRIDKAMYGLPQAGYIAQRDLGKLLRDNGFRECPRTPQVFRHESRALTMSIVVDDFGVLYLQERDVLWLLEVLRTKYELKVDWSGEKYIGITLQWDYVARTCRMSMPDYVRKGVSRFLGEDAQRIIKHSPAQYTQFKYGHQDAPQQDESAPLSKERVTRVQALVGYFLYYARAVDPTMLVVLGQIASSQSKATENVEAACAHFLHYAATYPNATIIYRASGMILRVVTDASFHSEINAGTRMGGVHYLGDMHGSRLNGMIDTLCKLIDVVVASAAEAELGALFFNAKMATETRYMLEDFGFPQPPTSIECDNQCAVGIANGDVKLKRSRAMDVRFHWIADRVRQGQFVIHWQKGSQNLADYFTKVHPATHHRTHRVHFVCDKIIKDRSTSEMRRKKAPRNVSQQVANYVKYVYSCSTE